MLTLGSPHGLFYTLISAHVTHQIAGSVALPWGVERGAGWLTSRVACVTAVASFISNFFCSLDTECGEGGGGQEKKLHKCLLA